MEFQGVPPVRQFSRDLWSREGCLLFPLPCHSWQGMAAAGAGAWPWRLCHPPAKKPWAFSTLTHHLPV